jgi:hypothetical protein
VQSKGPRTGNPLKNIARYHPTHAFAPENLPGKRMAGTYELYVTLQSCTHVLGAPRPCILFKVCIVNDTGWQLKLWTSNGMAKSTQSSMLLLEMSDTLIDLVAQGSLQ